MNAFHIIYFGLLYTALLIGLRQYRTASAPIRLITLYLAAHALVDSTAKLLKLTGYVENNLFLYHFFTPVEYGLLAGFFATSTQHIRHRRWIAWSVPVLVVVNVASACWLEGLTQNNSLATALLSLLVITWALLALRELTLMPPATAVSHSPLFWISMGLLVYYAGTLLVETTLNYFITAAPRTARWLYQTEYPFAYLLWTMIAVGLRRLTIPPVVQ